MISEIDCPLGSDCLEAMISHGRQTMLVETNMIAPMSNAWFAANAMAAKTPPARRIAGIAMKGEAEEESDSVIEGSVGSSRAV